MIGFVLQLPYSTDILNALKCTCGQPVPDETTLNCWLIFFVVRTLLLVSQGSWIRYPVWPHTFVAPSAHFRKAVVSYWRKYVHELLVNRLGGLNLPRKCVVRLTDRPDMTLDFYCGRKTAIQQQRPNWLKFGRQFYIILTSLSNLFTHNYYPVRCWQVLLALQWPLMQNFG